MAMSTNLKSCSSPLKTLLPSRGSHTIWIALYCFIVPESICSLTYVQIARGMVAPITMVPRSSPRSMLEARLRRNWRMVLKGFCVLLLISERFSNLEVSISSRGVAGSCNTRSIGLPQCTTPSDIERFPLLLYRSPSSYFGMWGGILR